MIGQLLGKIGQLFGKKEFSYRCQECGELHSGAPSFSFKYPPYYLDVPEMERVDRVHMSNDLCHIEPSPDDADGEPIYCIRVILEIPIDGSPEPFTWGIWVSQSKESFERYKETFSGDQSADGSFGWLPVHMTFYDDTEEGEPFEQLGCDVEWGEVGKRPKAYLWESEHQLSVDQRNGISWKKAAQIANLANSGSLRG